MTNTAGADAASGPWPRFGWLMAVVWMAFLAYPTISLVGSAAGFGWLVLGWAALAGFAVAYVVGFILGMRAAWGAPSPLVRALFWVLIGCAAATVPAIETGALSFLPFIMSYASYGMHGRWHWITNISAIVGAAVVIVATDRIGQHVQVFLVIVMIAVVNTITTWLIGRSVDAERVRLQLATSDERAAVARDVHDLLGHSLTAVKLKAELARRLVERDPERAAHELDEIVRLATEAIAGVRATVTGITQTGLAEQVAASTAVLESAGLDVRVEGRAEALAPAQSLPAGWILREATTNVLRHADARTVRIRIEPGLLAVDDDGCGVSGEQGNGLRGMAERAAAAGAVLRVDAAPAGGTRVSVTW